MSNGTFLLPQSNFLHSGTSYIISGFFTWAALFITSHQALFKNNFS